MIIFILTGTVAAFQWKTIADRERQANCWISDQVDDAGIFTSIENYSFKGYVFNAYAADLAKKTEHTHTQAQEEKKNENAFIYKA